MKIILASQNKGKVREIKSIFENSPFEIISLYDLGNNIEIEETGSTFSENAFIKAKAIFEHYKEPSIADDSGIMVEQLDGRPGVISARYAGPNCTFEDNNLK
ncbi:MAG: non-canonical purine NTP pyrophosphatase, partial [Melioribacter sp.]|nr:non-canonical purine NTP pyrophosphatase [Melioribacter sp.]